MKCNICGSTEFKEVREGRPNVTCAQCGSSERARVLMLFLKKHDMPQPGMRVLHFAPEECIARYIHSRIGSEHYETYDIAPENYMFDFQRARRLDICKQIGLLNKRRYDLIIHNHVLEHLPCNYTMVLLKLHALLKPNGFHAFSVPIRAGFSYSEDLSANLSRRERTERFGQGGHVRNFGLDDIEQNLGMIFNIKDYNLRRWFSEKELANANIARGKWTTSSASVFFLGRSAAPLLAYNDK